MGCHFLLQGIFPTQGSNPGLLHCKQTLYRLTTREAPKLSIKTLPKLINAFRMFAGYKVNIQKPNSLLAQSVKNLPAMQETQVQSLGWEDPLEKGMASHSSILAWRIPRTEKPGGLESIGSQRVGHD